MSTIEPIELTAYTDASPITAWAALTIPEQVAEWFADVTEVGPVGSRYAIDFGDGSRIEGVVRDLEPGRRLAYSWAWVDAEADAAGPGEETLVTWSVAPHSDGGTEIRLVHSGWSEADSSQEMRDDHAEYWESYLDDLVALLDEQGSAEDPGPDSDGAGAPG